MRGVDKPWRCPGRSKGFGIEESRSQTLDQRFRELLVALPMGEFCVSKGKLLLVNCKGVILLGYQSTLSDRIYNLPGSCSTLAA